MGPLNLVRDMLFRGAPIIMALWGGAKWYVKGMDVYRPWIIKKNTEQKK